MKRRSFYLLTLPRLGNLEFVALLGGVCLHLLTVFLAFRLSGFVGAGLSLLFPVAAQVYWIVELWDTTGKFWSPFTLMCLIYVTLWVLICIRHFKAGSRDKRER